MKKEPARSARQRVATVITATKAQGGDAARRLNSACHGVRAKNCLEDFSANPSGQQQQNKACCDQVGEHRLALEADPVHGPHGSDDGNPADGLVNEGKYGHGSLLCGFTLGRLALDKLRPDSRPVVGAEVLTGNCAARVQLKSRSQFGRTWAQPVHHIPEMTPGRAAVGGELFSLVHRFGSEEVFQVHAQITPHGVSACQHQQV